MAKKVLGKGLSAIISSSHVPADDIEKAIIGHTANFIDIYTDKIIPNPDQPRKKFDKKEIEELADSIKSVGIIQPVIVRKKDNRYILIAGERRLRAAVLLGLKQIKSIVLDAGDEKSLTIALVENIQRTDLDPIEEARAYRLMVSRLDINHQKLSGMVGKNRATISNSLRLLNLPEEIQEGLSAGTISTGHAKVILSVNGVNIQKMLYRKILEKDLSVRELEKITKDNTGGSGKNNSVISHKNAHMRKLEANLESFFGTKVEIKNSGNKGKIEINFYSLDDFDRILDLLN